MATLAVYQRAVEQFGDWRWRLNNLYSIIDEDGNKVIFHMNGAQQYLFDGMHHLNVILKARQLGFTTFIQLFMLDVCMFNSNVHAGTIAHTREDAEEIFKEKVHFPYDNLPDGLKAANAATEVSARKLAFANSSLIRVGTSLRSGTFQYLHISEYGKICAKYPEKAREIKTGAFNTVHAGQVIWVESTAEGQEGDFYGMCQEAQSLERRGADLTPLDFKFFFYPWFNRPSYVLPAAGVMLTTEDKTYFEKLRIDNGIELTAEQKAWYVKKAAQQGSDMKREFPSTPKEAFEASIEGAYYAVQMARAETQGRICELPIEPSIGTETWWDLGMDDLMTIVWVQRVGPWFHIIDYYENSGEGLGHYATILQDRQRTHGLVYTDHVWPHDGNVRILDEKGRRRVDVMRELGFEMQIVERGQTIQPGIEATRSLLAKCRIDEVNCKKLISALKNYRKEWDDVRGAFRDKPLKNWAGHGADAVRTGAMFDPFQEELGEHGFPELEFGRSETTGY